MNEAFPAEEHGGLFRTLWHGVLDLEKQTLRHVSGGHPPAALFLHGTAEDTAVELGWWSNPICRHIAAPQRTIHRSRHPEVSAGKATNHRAREAQ